MAKTSNWRPSRRSFLRAGTALLGAASLSAPFIRPARAAARQIVINQSGGAYQEANQKAFFTPFTQATGIEVVISNLSVTGPILASVKQNQVQVDILDTNESDLMILEAQGALAPIDYEHMKLFKASDIHASVVRPNMVGKTYWASVMAYRTDAFPKDGYPKTWADFWDVKRFPGARSLQDNEADLAELEFALIADGVPAQTDALYPIDVERAFKSLSKIRPNIIKFWNTGALPQSLLERKEVVLASIWNGRAQTLIDAGAPVAINWNQARRQVQFWASLKSGPNHDLAMQFIDFAMQPEHQAEATRYISYGPTNTKADPLVRPQDAAKLATTPEWYKLGFDVDAKWWSANSTKVDERWKEWSLL